MKKNCDAQYEKIKNDECDNDIAELINSMLNIVCIFMNLCIYINIIYFIILFILY
jgi:hypothetical protein